MKKQIIHREEVQKLALEGMEIIASIVKRTLGPGGLPVIIERIGQALNGLPLGPKITKDGVSVANECSHPDPKLDVIIQSIKDICRKTNNRVGDGPLDINTKIITPTGFKLLKDLKVGDTICGTNGTHQKVTGVFDTGKRELFKVTTASGTSALCCKDHLWTVTDFLGKTHNLPLRHLMEDYKKMVNGSNHHKYAIPVTHVEFEENPEKLLLDPYLLGVLLGDGSLTGTGSIEFSIGLAKKHILDKIVLPEGLYLKTTFVDHKNYFRVKIQGTTPDGKSAKKIIEEIGLLGVSSHTKFIPDAYLHSSLKTRKKLLQGLLDTDAYIKPDGRFDFTTVSEELANDLSYLARSMGRQLRKVLKNRENSNGYSTNSTFRIWEILGCKHGSKIVDIESTGKVADTMCIKVSNPDHLYLIEDFMVTHNTTTSITIADAILKASTKLMQEDPSLNPQFVKESLEESFKHVSEALKQYTIKVNDLKLIKDVATISANGDEEIGSIILEAISKVGADGKITIDEGNSQKLELDVVDGYVIDSGAEGNGVFFNNQSGTRFEANNCVLLINDGKMSNATQILAALQDINKYFGEGKIENMPPVLILANEFSSDVISTMQYFKEQQSLQICLVKGPHVTKVRTAYYDDIAVYSGGSRFGNGNRMFTNINPQEDVGLVKKVIVSKNQTILYDGQGSEECVIARIDSIKVQKEEAESAYDESILTDRMAALANGVAKIGVGGTTEFEMKEKYDRVEDALNASKAAIAEGVIPGGGTTLLRISEAMEAKTPGEKILKEALKEPFLQILRNLGLDEKDLDIKKLLEEDQIIFDGRDKKYKDYLEAGVLDPVKVTRTALENALSISSLLSTAGGAIIFSDKPKLEE